MVFRLEQGLVAQAMAQKPGSNPSWVNPILLAEEKKKTDLQAGLAIGGMIAEQRQFNQTADLKKQEFQAVGKRMAHQAEIERQVAANKAANDLVLSKQKFQQDLLLEDADSQNALKLKQYESDSARQLQQEKYEQERQQKLRDNVIDLFKTFTKNRTDVMIADRNNAAALERTRVLGLGQALSGVGDAVAQGTIIARDRAKMDNERAQELQRQAQGWLGYSRIMAESKDSKFVDEDKIGEMDAMLKMLRGGDEAKVPSREEMVATYQGLTGNTPPPTWNDATLATQIGFMMENEARIVGQRANDVLLTATKSTGMIISMLSEFGISPETSNAYQKLLEGALDNLGAAQEINTGENRTRANLQDTQNAEAWRRLTEQLGTLPPVPTNAPR